MRAYQIFAALPSEHAVSVLQAVRSAAPAAFQQALAATAAALHARPVFLARKPAPEQCQAIRRTLARVASNALAEELLAVYFIECKKELLREWLDAVGVEHEDGVLKTDRPPQPPVKKLRAAVQKFRTSEASADRELLLRTFAAQAAIEWPELEALLAQ